MHKDHIRISDLRGYGRLAIDATLGVTNLVEAMHHTILRLPAPFGARGSEPIAGVHGLAYKVLKNASGWVYGTIRGVTNLVGGGLDAALAHLEPELAQVKSSGERAAVISILNGVLGDYLKANNNPLAISMNFCRDGEALELSTEALAHAIRQPKRKVLILLHGHCMNELQWTRNGHNHGEALAAANGYTPMYLRYNTGLHISENGRSLAALLEKLVRVWPVAVDELSIVGYSMGGLVARSAFHYGAEAKHSWMKQVQKLIFIGTPHHGSMVEQGGNFLDLALEASPYSEALSRLGKIRGAGTTDLRHGNLIDEDWAGHDRFAGIGDSRQALQLPAGVKCFAIAAMIAKKQSELSGKLIGDGLVPLQSGLGQHKDKKRALDIPAERRMVFYGTTHLGLLSNQEVCAQLQEWMRL